jgi:hypothetical protein
VKRRLMRLRQTCSRLLDEVIQNSCFIAVVVIDDRKLAARYRRRHSVSIDEYRWDARQLRRRLAKLEAVLWCDISRYEYLRSLPYDD